MSSFVEKAQSESPTGSSSPVQRRAGSRTQLRQSLRGQGFEAQQVMLKPDGSTPVQRRTTMQDIALGQDVNEREREILENDEDAASAWVQAAAWAVGIASAYSATRPNSGDSMYLGRADALRHCLWNAYMAFMLGERKAKALADAHELPDGKASGNTAVDRDMDMFNNRVGRTLGVTAREGSVITRAFALSFIAAAALEYVNAGSLKVVDRSDQSAWRLVPSNTDGIS